MGQNWTSKLGPGTWTASLGHHTSNNLPLVSATQSHGVITESSDVGRDVALNVKDILYDMLSCHTSCFQYERFSDPAPMPFSQASLAAVIWGFYIQLYSSGCDE